MEFEFPDMGLFGIGRKPKTDSDEPSNPQRREALKRGRDLGIGALATYFGGGVGSALAGGRGPIVPWGAKIWDAYPNMLRAIQIINDPELNNLYLGHVMLRETNFADPGQKIIPPKKIPESEMHTPQYWLLAKLALDNRTYTRIANIAAGEKTSKQDVPVLHDKGVLNFAQGMRADLSREQREELLLKALYIGATGSENGANPILDGSYMRRPEVMAKVKEWKEKHNYAPHSNEGNHLSAYLSITLRGSVRNGPLVSLSTLALTNNSRGEKEKIFAASQGDAKKRMGVEAYYIKNKFL